MIGIAFLAAMIYGLFSRGPLLIYLFFITSVFGTLTIVPTNLSGGLTLQPQSLCALFLAAWVFRYRDSARLAGSAATTPGYLGLMTLYLVVALIGAAFLPRLFAGAFEVVAYRPVPNEAPLLKPTSANISQSFYVLCSTLTAISFFVLFRIEQYRAHIWRAILVGGALLVVAGVADLATSGTNLLAPFRTASYTIISDDDVQGAKRVIGLSPEASAYGGLCASMAALVYFARPAFSASRRMFLVVSVIATALALFALLSTSSAALVTLFGFWGLAFAHWGLRLFKRPRERWLEREVWFDGVAGAVVLVGCAASAYLLPQLIATAFNWIDMLVLQKGSSSSYLDRSVWNQVGLDAFFATFGLGVGLGGSRTSSWPIGVISNVGLIGALLLLLIVAQALLRRSNARTPLAKDLLAGLKLAMLTGIINLCLIGASADFGLFLATLIGGLAGLSAPSAALASRSAMTAAEAGRAPGPIGPAWPDAERP